MKLVFDIETDGFLEHVSKLHVLVIKDVETGKRWTNQDTRVPELLSMLTNAEQIIGHNIIKYDIPVLRKLFPWFDVPEAICFDTLVCSRLLWPNIGDSDGARIGAGTMPGKSYGSQSLEAWGYRMGQMKGEYTKDFIELMGAAYVNGSEWLEWSQEMHDYCLQDVEVTQALYERILKKDYSQQAIELEHKVAFICSKMERTGWPFNTEKAVALYAEIAQKRNDILREMQETFEPLTEERWSEKTGKRLKDKVTEFNPGSRKQIAERLVAKYGWKPEKYTDKGQVQIDETVLEGLEYPEAKILARYFLLEKRVGQLAEGDNAWLKLERKGKLHGGYNPNGAVTGRCTHQTPNLAQVPAVRSLYGKDCRGLFEVPRGFRQVGCDQAGIELRLLAHYMYPYDNGAYAHAVVQGKQSDGTDAHTLNQKAFELHFRDSAKTAIYAMLYGAAGLRMFLTAQEDHRKAGKDLGSTWNEKAKKTFGNKMITKFLERTPALKFLREAVAKAAKTRGFIRGLDGRCIHIRHEHAALNTLLQGAGAVASKQWLVEIVKACDAKGWKWSEDWTGDYALCGWIHDEVQAGARTEIAEEFAKIVQQAAKTAGEVLGLRVPVDADFSIGMNWAETH
jgi:DNA polymerase-1